MLIELQTFNILAPEPVVFIAVMEWLSAKDGLAAMRMRGQKDWSMRLAFFADMGGFELEDGRHLEDGFQFLEWFDGTWAESGREIELDVERIEKDVKDRSKQDIVVKLFTVCQAFWLFIQSIVRIAEGRGISELEVTTCAYIACTVITYACWLRKPYDVQQHITLRAALCKTQACKDLERRSTDATVVALTVAVPDGPEYRPVPLVDEEKVDTPALPKKLDANARYTPLNRVFFNPKKAWLCKFIIL